VQGFFKLALALTRGALGFGYPCPFLVVEKPGSGQLAINVLLIDLSFAGIAAVLVTADRRFKIGRIPNYHELHYK